MSGPTESKTNTVNVPAVGSNPATLYYAANKPMRLLVRNTGAVLIFISHDSNSLTTANTADTFELPPGSSEVFILMPRQGLFAGASGVGGFASIAASEALPMLMES
jgi:hypothetical protein